MSKHLSFKIVSIILLGLVLFFAGYQLAIYQIDKGNTLFPHFSFNNASKTSKQQCPPGDTAESPITENNSNSVTCLAPGAPLISE